MSCTRKASKEVIAELDDVLARFSAPGMRAPTEVMDHPATLEYQNPVGGGPAFKTIGCWATPLRPGAHTKAHRHSTSAVYPVVKGRGASIIAGTRFDWEHGDTFVLPNWAYHEHLNLSTRDDAALFSVNDRPVFTAFGCYREQPYLEHDGHQPVTSIFEPAE